MKRYKARNGATFKNEDAQAIGEFIESFADKNPEEILKQIRKNKNHPIYKYIEWDKDSAAYQYQIQQVRNIINHIVLDIEQIPDVRAFVSVKEFDTEDCKPSYHSIESVEDSAYMKSQIIMRAKQELYNWAERYKQYNELSSIVSFIESELKEVPEITSNESANITAKSSN